MQNSGVRNLIEVCLNATQQLYPLRAAPNRTHCKPNAMSVLDVWGAPVA